MIIKILSKNMLETETLDSVVIRYIADQIGGLYLPSDELFSVLPYCSWILVAAKLDLLLLFLSDILTYIFYFETGSQKTGSLAKWKRTSLNTCVNVELLNRDRRKLILIDFFFICHQENEVKICYQKFVFSKLSIRLWPFFDNF